MQILKNILRKNNKQEVEFLHSEHQTIRDIGWLYDIKLNSIEGKPLDLKQFKGKKILFVNVASNCLFAHQYKMLQELYEKYNEKLVVIGVLCNQFWKENNSEEQILENCRVKYEITFPLTEKINVLGENQHLLYTWLTRKINNGVKDSKITWNFCKYLVDENGFIINSWNNSTCPSSKSILKHL